MIKASNLRPAAFYDYFFLYREGNRIRTGAWHPSKRNEKIRAEIHARVRRRSRRNTSSQPVIFAVTIGGYLSPKLRLLPIRKQTVRLFALRENSHSGC